jgi:hypothetical protein
MKYTVLHSFTDTTSKTTVRKKKSVFVYFVHIHEETIIIIFKIVYLRVYLHTNICTYINEGQG